MDGTGQTGVKGVDHTEYFERPLGIRYRCPDQRLLDRPLDPLGIPG